jgi:hypothetical protein
MTLNPVATTPPLPCLVVDASASTCDCAIDLRFDRSTCTRLEFEPHHGAQLQTVNRLELRTSGEGEEQRWVVPFTADGVAHRLLVSAEVSFIGGMCECSLPVGASSPPALPYVLAMTAVPLALVWRRRRRHPAEPQG